MNVFSAHKNEIALTAFVSSKLLVEILTEVLEWTMLEKELKKNLTAVCDSPWRTKSYQLTAGVRLTHVLGYVGESSSNQ